MATGKVWTVSGWAPLRSSCGWGVSFPPVRPELPCMFCAGLVSMAVSVYVPVCFHGQGCPVHVCSMAVSVYGLVFAGFRVLAVSALCVSGCMAVLALCLSTLYWSCRQAQGLPVDRAFLLTGTWPSCLHATSSLVSECHVIGGVGMPRHRWCRNATSSLVSQWAG